MPLSCVRQPIVIAIASDEHLVWRGHRKEATRGPPCGPRVTRPWCARGSLLLPCAPTWLSLIAVSFFRGATHRGQQETPTVTLSHGRYRLRVRRMAVLWTVRRPSLCRRMHRQYMRNALRDVTTIIFATACTLSYIPGYACMHYRRGVASLHHDCSPSRIPPGSIAINDAVLKRHNVPHRNIWDVTE